MYKAFITKNPTDIRTYVKKYKIPLEKKSPPPHIRNKQLERVSNMTFWKWEFKQTNIR